VKTIPLKGKEGRFDHLAIDHKGERLFVANLSNDSLDIVDLKAGKLVKQLPGQRKAQGVAFVPDLNRIYQGNGTDGVCNVFDGRTFERLHSLKLPAADNVRYDAATGLVYVGHAEASITAFDAKTFEVKATIKLPGPPEAFQIDSGRKRMYVNCLKPATVAVVDLNKHVVAAKHPLKLADANYPMALDVKGQRVFVGCREKPMVVTLDAKTGEELSGVAIPGDIDDLFYDAKRNRLYASCGEGVLAVLEEKDKAFSVVEKVSTAKLARTCLFDSVGDRLYVVIPKSGDAEPSLRVYQPQP
jgi:DNA-binding beta-propeller fold protein YncE